MTLNDLPLWAQRIYWYWHGPVGSHQPRGANYVSAQGTFAFLITEAVLAIVLLLGWWGCDKLISDGQANKLVKALLAVVIGGVMLLKLLAFAGVT